MQSPTFTSAATILARLLGVDGPGSLLNADLLDDKHASEFELTGASAAAIAAHLIAANPHTQYLLASGYTAADVLSKLLGVDGAGSGLDADLLDGLSSAAFATASAFTTHQALATAHNISAFGTTLIDDADAATARTTLGLVIGTNVQAQNTNLAALAGLTGAADKAPYFTGAGALALADFPTFGRSLAAAVSASAGRTVLGLGTMATEASTAYLLATGATTGATSQRQVFTNGITGPNWRPAGDSTTALRLQDAAGGTVVTVDTTNKRLIGAGAAQFGANDGTNCLTLKGGGPTITSIDLFIIASSAYPYMQFLNNATGGGTSAGFKLGIESDRGSIAMVQNWPIDFWTNATVKMSLSAAGYLGIGLGTGAVSALLDLAASTTTRASLRLRHGVAPTTPNDGDMWTSTAGLFVRINGVTVGPLT